MTSKTKEYKIGPYSSIYKSGKAIAKVPRFIVKVTGNKATIISQFTINPFDAPEIVEKAAGGKWQFVDFKPGGNSPNILWEKGDDSNTKPAKTFLSKIIAAAPAPKGKRQSRSKTKEKYWPSSVTSLARWVSSRLDATKPVLVVDHDGGEMYLVGRGQPAGHFKAGQFIKHKNVEYIDLSDYVNDRRGITAYIDRSLPSSTFAPVSKRTADSPRKKNAARVQLGYHADQLFYPVDDGRYDFDWDRAFIVEKYYSGPDTVTVAVNGETAKFINADAMYGFLSEIGEMKRFFRKLSPEEFEKLETTVDDIYRDVSEPEWLDLGEGGRAFKKGNMILVLNHYLLDRAFRNRKLFDHNRAFKELANMKRSGFTQEEKETLKVIRRKKTSSGQKRTRAPAKKPIRQDTPYNRLLSGLHSYVWGDKHPELAYLEEHGVYIKEPAKISSLNSRKVEFTVPDTRTWRDFIDAYENRGIKKPVVMEKKRELAFSVYVYEPEINQNLFEDVLASESISEQDLSSSEWERIYDEKVFKESFEQKTIDMAAQSVYYMLTEPKFEPLSFDFEKFDDEYDDFMSC